jgi:polysaccharide transporter, PST family
VLRGLAWKTVSRGMFEVSKIAVAVVLARLLTPHEYGIAGMVLVLTAFQPVLSGTALASVLVQRNTLTEADRSTVFWMCGGVGLLATVAGIALSGPAADLYGDPQVQPLFAATSCVFLISALGVAQSHVLMRDMDFRALELRAMAGVVVGAVLAIAAAVEGYGAWALVVQQLGTFATGTLLLWVFSSWRPRLRFSRRSMREVKGFGARVSGTMALTQLTQNTDNVLIGKFLGAAPLGAYALAYNVILAPFSRLTSPLFEVLYPVFSRLQDDRARLRSVWLRVLRVLVVVAAPSMLVLVAVGPDMVPVVFGPQWDAAAPVVQILAVVGIAIAVQGLNSLLLQSVGRTRQLFWFAIASFASGLVAFVIGLQWGIVGVAACFAVATAIVQPVYLWLTARCLGLGLWGCLRALSGVLQVAFIVAAAAALTRVAMLETGAPAAVRLAAALAVAAVLYVPACFWRAPDVVSEIRQLLGRPPLPVATSSAPASLATP